MFSGVVIAIVCLPALLTFVWFFEVAGGLLCLAQVEDLFGCDAGRAVTSDDRTYSRP